MAKTPQEVIEELRKKINTAKMELLSTKTTQSVADYAADMVRVRTRLGYGVDGGVKRGLDSLSDGYKKTRAKAKKAGTLYSETTPNRSNLTFTGQMLNSIYGIAYEAGRFLLTFKGDRNQEVAGYAVEGGRPFFSFSRAEVQQVIGQYRKLVVQLFRKDKL